MMSGADEPRKYRCESCGVIGWTTLSRGCHTCDSKQLVPFREPRQYAKYRRLLHDFSIELAKLRSEPGSRDLAALSTSYAARFEHDLVGRGNATYSDFLQPLTKVLQHYSDGTASAQETIESFSELIGRAQERSEAASKLIGELVIRWLELEGERAAHQRGAKSVTLVSREFNLIPLLLGQDIESPESLTGLAHYINEGVERFVANTGGSMRLESAVKHDENTMHFAIPFNYHLNLTETAFQLLKDSVKLVPVIVALCHLELHGEIVAIAEAIKQLLSNLTKLHEGTGEVCLYESIVMFRKKTKQYPTTQDLLEELQSATVSREKCRFFDGKRAKCVIEAEDLNRILSFLRDKKVVQKVSADAWWVQL